MVGCSGWLLSLRDSVTAGAQDSSPCAAVIGHKTAAHYISLGERTPMLLSLCIASIPTTLAHIGELTTCSYLRQILFPKWIIKCSTEIFNYEKFSQCCFQDKSWTGLQCSISSFLACTSCPWGYHALLTTWRTICRLCLDLPFQTCHSLQFSPLWFWLNVIIHPIYKGVWLSPLPWGNRAQFCNSASHHHPQPNLSPEHS